MGNTAQAIASMVDILPENDQQLAYELVKKLLLAWDPDFTKVTPEEAAQLEKAERNFDKGETVSMDEIDWD
ncbi:hypothetical protein [Ruminococcus sp.]|jgi:alkyl hydroperoxide reductase subunit AhpC|uniref:hypothetical protein n=1 Tax=Ruminococcus sp. TaxID=41978 RepID=UPI00280481DB|nr:hypothetical protein [Ruminococcus sp.]MEE0023598.1 hypothetical protein [Ruminococcus sp.]